MHNRSDTGRPGIGGERSGNVAGAPASARGAVRGFRRTAARLGLAALLFVGPLVAARAEVAVLVPGYLGGPGDGRTSGITGSLERAGWRDGGDLGRRPGPTSGPAQGGMGPRTFYTLALPTEAPLGPQAQVLGGYLDLIRARHPGEGLTLVGHSAGGVVARLYMVQNPRSGVTTLVSIASPHLGTDTAEIGALLGQTPLAMFAPMVGAGTLNRSQGLYRDLSRENPQSVLFWLNRQPHPPARYVSVVRSDDSLLGDLVVPTWSQDMNQVPALRGRSARVEVQDGHGLSAADGRVLTEILDARQRS